MSCPNDSTLWTYAEGALDAAERAVLGHHLASCAACRSSLSQVQTTRDVLRAASGAMPKVSWRTADEQVMAAATQHVARSVRWRVPLWAVAGSAVAAGIALFVWAPWNERAGIETGPAFAGVTVESANFATLADLNGRAGALVAGAAVASDGAIATGSGGSAMVRLPDESRARLGADSLAMVVRASKREVALRLVQGSIAVQAAHVERDAFLVDADVVQVRVVGTAFRVEREGARVTISVAEGRVLVEPLNGQGRLVDANHRVVVTEEGAWIQDLPLEQEDTAEFAALGMEVAARARVQPPVATAATPSASKRKAPIKDRAQKPTSAAPGPVPTAAPSPAAAGGVQQPPSTPEPDEWSSPAFEEPGAITARSPGVTPPEKLTELPANAEGLFLRRAQEALKTGKCQNFELGLQDVVEASSHRGAREMAQILRARCFDEQLQPDAAAAEYRRYLRTFPSGRFAAEAQQALGAAD